MPNHLKTKIFTLSTLLFCSTISATLANNSNHNINNKINITKETSVGKTLQSADDFFREIYATKVDEKVDKAKPFLLIANDKIYLYKSNFITAKTLTPVIYNLLKSVDHIPLAVFVLLDDKTDQILDEKTILKLKRLEQFSHELSDRFEYSYILDDTVKNQIEILKATSNFCQPIIEKKQISQDNLQNFASLITKALMKNADIATANLLENLNSYLQELDFNEQNKKALHVIILTAHMAQSKQCIYQYFQKYFNETAEGHHIIVLEDSNTDEMAIKLLGKHILDTDIANAFFNDPDRMHKDLLYQAAQKYLGKQNEN